MISSSHKQPQTATNSHKQSQKARKKNSERHISGLAAHALRWNTLLCPVQSGNSLSRHAVCWWRLSWPCPEQLFFPCLLAPSPRHWPAPVSRGAWKFASSLAKINFLLLINPENKWELHAGPARPGNFLRQCRFKLQSVLINTEELRELYFSPSGVSASVDVRAGEWASGVEREQARMRCWANLKWWIGSVRKRECSTIGRWSQRALCSGWHNFCTDHW